MTRYTDAELEEMLASSESDLVERKESLQGNAPRTVREAACAFANDLPGHRRAGVVFVGIRDDVSPSGLAITDELLRALADIKTDGNIVPPPSLAVSKRTLRGEETAVVIVEPSDSPPVCATRTSAPSRGRSLTAAVSCCREAHFSLDRFGSATFRPPAVLEKRPSKRCS
jgi:predicted HTH transcriptional regulator